MKNIQINEDQVSFSFNGTRKEAAILRSKLQTEIYNYAIEKVIFYENTSREKEEKLALRFGLLIIDQNCIDKGTLDVKGPKMVMSNDIVGIKTLHNMPIIYLRENETLKCDFILDKNCGKYHQKYNPVYCVRFNDDLDFNLGLTGVLTFEQIIEQL